MVGRLWLYQRIIVVRRKPCFMESDGRQSTRVRFNESDHGRATMVVPANNRRATKAVFNGERRSSIDRALFDILSSDSSLPLTPRLLVA
ncbi:hypothetical protein DPMN_043794 [Dreissena polymorpha]|uniref:Uncharacterized protein n=1 Tax=Dreissena polymorpha TaxID=45954 RepID=A0A9D4HYB6_DREPO|nr:hypothetical protein DPMN_043794 [Dreissena polymorpha]